MELNLGGFRPDVVVTVMQTSSFYVAAYKLARNLGIPLVTIVHDDPEEIEYVVMFGRSFIRSRNAQVYSSSSARLCISPQLERLLAQRYGAEGEVLYPNRSRNTSRREPVENARLRRPGKLVIGYAGSLKYGYGHELERWVATFAQSGAVLRIYSVESCWFAQGPGVEVAGPSPTPEIAWERLKQECDAVVLPYYDDPQSHAALYRTHFPSKLPEYLGLGMPVIITGPASATGVIWGTQHPQACITLEHPTSVGWSDTIARLIANSELRMRLGQAAADIAAVEFDPSAIEHWFHAKLQAVGSKSDDD